MESYKCYIDSCNQKSNHDGCYVYCENHKYLIPKSKRTKIKELIKKLDSYDEESLQDLTSIYDSIFNIKLKHVKKNGLKMNHI